eukprot:10167296-Alexandrium_andersonii.AAC.1
MPLPAGEQGTDPRGWKGPAWTLGSPRDSGEEVDGRRCRRRRRRQSGAAKSSKERWPHHGCYRSSPDAQRRPRGAQRHRRDEGVDEA